MIGTDNLRFNNYVPVYKMFLYYRPLPQLVDEDTQFQAADVLSNRSAGDVWRTIGYIWKDFFLGPPEHIYVDQGSNYTSREMH